MAKIYFKPVVYSTSSREDYTPNAGTVIAGAAVGAIIGTAVPGPGVPG